MGATTRGLLAALLAAASFGTSGSIAKPLLDAGWSPTAAVALRGLIAGVAVLPIALIALRGRWNLLRPARWQFLGLGVFGVAIPQLAFFAAVQRIPVGTALLIEYTAPVLLVLWAWARTRRAPRASVLAGAVVASVGLALVVSPSGGGLDPVGLLWAAFSSLGLAAYYLLAAREGAAVPPSVLAAASLLIGAASLGLLGVTGLLPFTASTGDVPFLGQQTPWWVPMLALGLIATALAYGASIAAARLLGAEVASFVGLLEVVLAAAYAWLLLGQSLGPAQLGGGALILVGIALVQRRASRTRIGVEADVSGAA